MRPDEEGVPFIAKWNAFMRILLVDSSVKLVGRTLGDYANFGDGKDCRPGNGRLERDTGLGDKTIRNAMAFLRAIGAAKRVEFASREHGRADGYRLVIPETWDRMAVTGPNNYKFTCLWCGGRFNPEGGGSVGSEGQARWHLYRSVFCPPPRKEKGRAGTSCNVEWNREQQRSGLPLWGADDDVSWGYFRQARGDEW